MFAAILRLRPGHHSGMRAVRTALDLAPVPQRSPARFTRLTSHWRRERDGHLRRHWYHDPSWPGEPSRTVPACRQESCREHA
jgi:hypothetical protein